MSTPDDPRRAFAVEVVRRLQEAGHGALWAGGCVRDLLMGLEPSDFDVATDARPDRVMSLFRRTIPVGISFGVVRVLGPKDAGDVEVATFRSDGRYDDGRRPESVTFGTPEADALRRDFTINGMFLDPIRDRLIDLVGGRADLDAGILRAIGEPADRFAEDKLRLLRAVRFAARFGFRLEETTRSAIAAMAGQIRVVSAERIADELRKMLVDRRRAEAMRLASEMGLLDVILPPLSATRGLRRDPDAVLADDVWTETLRVLELLGDSPSFPLAFAALLHDVGMAESNARAGSDSRFFDHERTGREIAGQLGRDLKFANADRERIGWLIENHHALDRAPMLRRSTLKRILSRSGIGELLPLHRAIGLATTGDDSHVEFCEAYLRDQPDGPIDPPPLITGRDLAAMGMRPGPRFAEILERIRDAQLDQVLVDKEGALVWLRARMDAEGG